MTGLLQWVAYEISVLFMLKLTFTYSVEFVIRPENATFVPGVNFNLRCAVDNSSTAGLEWLFDDGNGSEINIGEWIEGSTYNPPLPGYQVDRPDSFTSVLTVLNPKMSSAGKYCCQYNNAQGQSDCAFMTDDSQASYSSVESDLGTATAGNHGVPVGTGVGIGVGTGVGIGVGIIAVVLLVAMLVIMRKKRKHSNIKVVAGQQNALLMKSDPRNG